VRTRAPVPACRVCRLEAGATARLPVPPARSCASRAATPRDELAVDGHPTLPLRPPVASTAAAPSGGLPAGRHRLGCCHSGRGSGSVSRIRSTSPRDTAPRDRLPRPASRPRIPAARSPTPVPTARSQAPRDGSGSPRYRGTGQHRRRWPVRPGHGHGRGRGKGGDRGPVRHHVHASTRPSRASTPPGHLSARPREPPSPADPATGAARGGPAPSDPAPRASPRSPPRAARPRPAASRPGRPGPRGRARRPTPP